jgi:hypothetical protein
VEEIKILILKELKNYIVECGWPTNMYDLIGNIYKVSSIAYYDEIESESYLIYEFGTTWFIPLDCAKIVNENEDIEDIKIIWFEPNNKKK